jgi:hypothetical protein
VLFDALQSRVLRLNSTGAAIWQLLSERPTYEGLVTHLATNFNIDEQHAREVLQPYLTDLLNHGIIGTSHTVRTEERNQ